MPLSDGFMAGVDCLCFPLVGPPLTLGCAWPGMSGVLHSRGPLADLSVTKHSKTTRDKWLGLFLLEPF